MEYTPRVLPWQDWAEWTETSRWLFAPDTNSRLRGVGRVKAWRARGRLPVAVDATASLLEVALLESGISGNRSALELRNLYSMVIIRAINGLVEGLQTKFYAEPVNAVAARLGIPQWLVDLRHEATHASLPSLATLRMGAQHLLDWLYRGYWEKQAQDLESAAAAATHLLVSYKNVAVAAQEESPNALCRACKAPKEEGGVGNGNGSSSTSSSSSSSSSSSGGGGIKTASDARFAEALDGLLASVTASFLTTFLLPALVRVAPEENYSSPSSSTSSASFFLLPDHILETEAAAAATTTTTTTSLQIQTPPEIKAIHETKHRQLYAPLLIRLQRKYPGFAHALFFRLAASSSSSSSRLTEGGGRGVTAGIGPTAGAAAAGEAAAAAAATSPFSSSSSPSPYTYSMWLSYLQSRDWHSHFTYGRSEAFSTLRRAPGIRFNLRDKSPGSWTSGEREYMYSSASLSVLREGLGLGLGVRMGEVEEGEEAGEEEEEEGGWVRCKEWVPCPLGGPVLRLGGKGIL